ncbi:hypothetical protein J4E81_004413 [Alternaria sp. BMP 2799]|nr:hypothetical protein J4E81_004413 [Alternaria sp. BMP 2799]
MHIIKFQDQNQNSANYDNGSFSNLALERWLQVTIPLTALTLFGAWSTYRFYSISARDLTFVERLKRAMLYAAPPSSEADSHEQMPPNHGPNNPSATTKGPAKRLGASISRFASRAQKFEQIRPVLPQYEGSEAKTG